MRKYKIVQFKDGRYAAVRNNIFGKQVYLSLTGTGNEWSNWSSDFFGFRGCVETYCKDFNLQYVMSAIASVEKQSQREIGVVVHA